MGKCVEHCDIETSYMCMKHNIYMCEDCIQCRDPNIYCKFRSSCPIWFLAKSDLDGKKDHYHEPARQVAG